MSRESEIGLVQGGLAPMPSPAAGLVRIRAVDNDALGLVAELDGPVSPDGYGQWGQIERPRKLPITTFAGMDPLNLPIPMLLDRWRSQRSVEPEIKVLETMLGRHGAERPSVVTIEGPGIPFALERDSSLRFVLGALSWGDDVRTVGSTGERGYAPLSVTATQYTEPNRVTTDDKTVRGWFTVGTKQPYTLARIAKKYGITKARILMLNKGRAGVPVDPNVRIKSGTKVRVS